MSNPETPSAVSNPPWWKLPIVWLVIAGPASVVVACIFTVGLAIKHVDPVLDTSKGHVKSTVDSPAVQARNHAASPARQPAER